MKQAKAMMAEHWPDETRRAAPPERRRLKTVPPEARGVELKCRRCHWRPQKSRRRLYELAEQARRRGERVAYLFPD
jgi:hypothetical protein